MLKLSRVRLQRRAMQNASKKPIIVETHPGAQPGLRFQHQGLNSAVLDHIEQRVYLTAREQVAAQHIKYAGHRGMGSLISAKPRQ